MIESISRPRSATLRRSPSKPSADYRLGVADSFRPELDRSGGEARAAVGGDAVGGEASMVGQLLSLSSDRIRYPRRHTRTSELPPPALPLLAAPLTVTLLPIDGEEIYVLGPILEKFLRDLLIKDSI